MVAYRDLVPEWGLTLRNPVSPHKKNLRGVLPRWGRASAPVRQLLRRAQQLYRSTTGRRVPASPQLSGLGPRRGCADSSGRREASRNYYGANAAIFNCGELDKLSACVAIPRCDGNTLSVHRDTLPPLMRKVSSRGCCVADISMCCHLSLS